MTGRMIDGQDVRTGPVESRWVEADGARPRRRTGFRVQCLGGISEVGASCLVVEAAGRRILVDAGIRPGRAGDDMLPDLARLQDDGGIDAVVVTHAHADHIGALPLAVGAFPGAPVLATPATLALMRVMLADAMRVAEGRWRDSGDLPPYNGSAVTALLERVRPLGYHEPYPLFRDDGGASNWQLTLFPAGHVLGAAMALLDTPEGSILISGDVSLGPQRTVGVAALPRRHVDALILESTYGNRLHTVRAAEEDRLVAQVGQVIARGGHCLIPAFALGRAQEVLLILAQARRDGRLAAPVWVDGLVRSVCAVYEAHGAAGTAALRRLIERQGNPFFSSDGPVRAVETPEQRQAIVAGEAAVIVSSSGMLTGGPSVFYAAQLAPQPRHAILITGYQDEEAAGAALLALSGADPTQPRRLRLGAAEVEVRCTVERYNLSAHADGDELTSLADRLRPRLTLLVHGDDAARAALAQKLHAQGRRCAIPLNGAVVALPGRRGANMDVEPAPPELTAEALAALIRQGPARRRWTAFELVQRLDGVVTPDRLAAAEDVLRTSGLFVAGLDRPDAYRVVGAGPLDPDEVKARIAAVIGEAPCTPFIKSSAYPLEGRVEVRFAFPLVAARAYGAALTSLSEETGWRVEIRAAPDLEAVQEAAMRLLPPGLTARKAAGLHLDQGVVAVAVQGRAAPEEMAAACARFAEETGYMLNIQGYTSDAEGSTMQGAAPRAVSNAKSRLSELAQEKRWPLPRYEATQSGAAHAPTFYAVATITVDGVALSSEPVAGANKKEAEQGAAQSLLAILEGRGLT